MYLEEKIDQLLSEQKRMAEIMELFLPNLETEKGVIHFLEITKNTFNSYMREGILEEGIHFEKKEGRRVFVPDAIVKMKKSGVKGRRKSIQIDESKIDRIKNKLGIMASCSHAGSKDTA